MAFGVKIKAEFWDDPRFLDLVAEIGEPKAYGFCLMAFKIGRAYWFKDQRPIPRTIWNQKRFPNAMVKHGLVEETVLGFYVRGMKECGELYLKNLASSEKGGETVRKKWDTENPNDNNKTGGPSGYPVGRPKGSPVLVLDLDLVLDSKNKENTKISFSEKTEELKNCLAVLKQTFIFFGIEKPENWDENNVMRLIQSRGAEKTRLAILGAKFEQKTESFDPAKHFSVIRLQDPKYFEKCVNLGAQSLGDVKAKNKNQEAEKYLAEMQGEIEAMKRGDRT